jgi:hypothetical protein
MSTSRADFCLGLPIFRVYKFEIEARSARLLSSPCDFVQYATNRPSLLSHFVALRCAALRNNWRGSGVRKAETVRYGAEQRL